MAARNLSAVDYLMRAGAGLAALFLVAPIVMIFFLSIDSRELISFPPKSFTLKWYVKYFNSAEWIDSTILSFFIALGASAIATLLGTFAAIALVRGKMPYKKIIGLILVSPLLLPLVVVAIAIYGVYAALGLVGSPVGLALAHAVLAMPFVVINVASALSAIPASYEEAAESLGASPLVCLGTVTIPLIWRGIAAGGVFAFVISFDEVVIAMFLTGASTITLPRRMLDGVFYDLSPILAAVSACLVIFNIVLALLGLWLSGSVKKGTVTVTE